MAWELLAIWAIVILAVTWFVRDERRLAADKGLAAAARYYAHAPQYRHIAAPSVTEMPAPRVRTGGLTRQQRTFLEALQR